MSEARHAPATARNRDPILAVLQRVLPETGTVLEIAAGTGEHAVHFAGALPGLTWIPTDPDRAALASIAAHSAAVRLPNLRQPLLLDVTQPLLLDVTQPWPVTTVDAIVCINMVHISPWAATGALLAGAGRLLPPGAPLYLYGPYRRAGTATAPSNEAFEGWLRAQNSEFGLRDLDIVAQTAKTHGLRLSEVIEMPANNLSVIFRR